MRDALKDTDLGKYKKTGVVGVKPTTGRAVEDEDGEGPDHWEMRWPTLLTIPLPAPEPMPPPPYRPRVTTQQPT